jgi:fucose 4-O-acetylase-like acetyltransferase
LSNFFRNSTALEHVNFSYCHLPDDMIVSALVYVPTTSLTTLCIGNTAAACDAVVDRLHSLVPQLKWLDVYSYNEGAIVSVQALARLAHRLKKSDVLSWWTGSRSLTIIASTSPPP